MRDELNQKISQLLDDDLSSLEATALLEKIRRNSELQEKMKRYELISLALKKSAYAPVDPEFSEAVSRAIAAEPIQLSTRNRPIRSPLMAWSALAASISLRKAST